jgi:carbon-monoxide dehydrogenase medium subunit
MYDFQYAKASNLSDATALLKTNEDARLLAGGMTLVPTLRQRLARPSHLIDLGGLPGLQGIAVSGGGVSIKAMTPHADVARSAEIKAAIPALAALAGGIGDPHVRHRGTIGGSVANNDPAADYPAALLALNATIATTERRIAADDFFVGMFETLLQPGEIITEITFPVPEKASYCKFRNPASRYAMAGVFVAKTGADIRVAITGAASCVFRQRDMERALAHSWNATALDTVVQPHAMVSKDNLPGSPSRLPTLMTASPLMRKWWRRKML